MALVDEAIIKIHSGAGGNGCISFRREKYIPRGGPNGGNGGTGGSVILCASENKSSLLDFKYRPIYQAKRGQHGMGSDMNGHSGEDFVIVVPRGTMVFDHEKHDLIADLSKADQTIVVAEGGRGGRGNRTFTSSTNRAPTFSTPGSPGISMELRLELRLLADVGLLGLPNAGKSTFLKTVSRANPKIADYPFTTLEPHLGVVYHKDQSFVVADLPGLIEGASSGSGLGFKFLKHVMRNRLLLHLVDISVPVDQIGNDITAIQNELADFDPVLKDRPQILVFTKTDLLDSNALKEKKQTLEKQGWNGHYLSSHSGDGREALLDTLAEQVHEWQKEN